MKTKEEIYRKHYLEKFKYDYPNDKAMARHLKEIALDAMEEYAEAHYKQKLAEMMPLNAEIYNAAAKHSRDCKIGGEVTNGASYRDGAIWLKNKFKSLLTQEEK